jgi:L-amino acid N-acyltransferase YncA
MIVRAAVPGDAKAMAALQNEIIGIGGTTAHQASRTEMQVLQDYIAGADMFACHVAEDAGHLLGFQAVGRHAALPLGWGDIGSYVQPGLQRGGVGRALFDATVITVQAAGITTINAAIRADNAPGLGYYARCGFVDYGQEPGFALQDGSVVGRVLKRYDLKPVSFD